MAFLLGKLDVLPQEDPTLRTCTKIVFVQLLVFKYLQVTTVVEQNNVGCNTTWSISFIDTEATLNAAPSECIQ
jgi:hypothetical protein